MFKIKNQISEIKNTNKKFKYIFLFLVCVFDLSFFIFNLGCGGSESSNGPASLSFSETKGDAGYIQLNITDSKNLSAAKAAQIEKYEVVIKGDGFDPVKQTISAQANGVAVNGIPIGKNRSIQVLALNAQDKVLREGTVENVDVVGGQTVQVSVALKSVPVFLNVAEGEYLSNQRLLLKILTDPKHSVVVEEDRPLADVMTSLSQTPVDEKGEAKFYPGVLSATAHQFILRDLDSGKFSSIMLNLWDGDAVKGAPLFAASQTQSSAAIPVALRFGQSISREGQNGSKSGEFFPNIAEVLWNTR